jgi:demethylmenaquinone methyltransferase / 2-methoxy-6-polyprenyl-1,4-benzoquinol methylase
MSSPIKKMYTGLPRRYELLNHLMTMGQDIRWRRKVIHHAVRKSGLRWLDLCTGTGETAVNLSRNCSSGTQVYALDFSLPMMNKLMNKPDSLSIFPILADASLIPLPKNTFDLVTVTFATRNLNISGDHLTHCLAEIHRILKPGGLFLNLETSQPPGPVVRKLFRLYITLVVRQLGFVIAGRQPGYRYLFQSMTRHYGADEFADILQRAGFKQVQYERYMLGAVALHQGIKS